MKITEDILKKLSANSAPLPECECKPLLLADGPGWIVAVGGVNVFTSSVKEDGSFGSRIFVTHIDKGGLLFSALLFNHKEERVCLLADSLPNSSIVPLNRSWSDFFGSEDKDVANFVRSGFYEWIEKLSASLNRGNVPVDCKLVPEDDVASISYSPGDTFHPEHGVVWVSVKSGFCVLCGNEENPLMAEGSVFPLSHRLWLKSLDETQVQFRSSGSVMPEDGLLAMFDGFYRIFYRAFLLAGLYYADIAQERRKQLSELEAKALSSSLDNLAALNSPGKNIHVNLSNEALAEPCLAVLETLSQSMGAEFKFNDKIPENLSGPELLCNILEHSSVYYRRLRLIGKWWAEETVGIAAFFKESGLPAGLIFDRHEGYKVYLPEKNKFVKLSPALAAAFDETAFSIYPQLPSTKLKLKETATFALRTLRPAFKMLLFVGIIESLVGLATPYLTGIIFNSVIPHADIFQLCQIAVILVTSAVTAILFSLARSFAMLRIKTMSDYNLQSAVVGRLLRLPLSLFKRYSTGDLAQRVMGVEAMREILADNVTSAVLGMFLALPNLLLMCYYSWKLALCGLAALLIFGIFISIVGAVNCINQRNYMTVSGELSGFVLQVLTGIGKIRHSISENRVFIKWSAMFEQETRWHIKVIKNSNFIMIFDALYPALITMVFFYLVGHTWKGVLNIGDYLSFNSAFTSFMTAFTGFAGIVPSIISLIPLYQRLKPVLDELPESDESLKSPGILDGRVDLKNIFYRYNEGSPIVINDLSISAEPGEFVAIAGPSGAGKSTIIRMLLGFENPESGGVYYSGRDISAVNKREFRKQIGSVLQSDCLIEGSIYQNIAGASNMSIEDAWEAARMAGCDKDIEVMPMGMHTIVGNSTVSGGQRQRILIARALAKKPRIIIFDEATSAVDNETQAHISDSLRKLNATRIIVAHRLSTIRHADRIYVLEKGRVVQTGNFDELIKAQGPFSTLAGRQMV